MRAILFVLSLFAMAQSAAADQFIATFMNPNHPRNLNITITQMDAGGGTTTRRRCGGTAACHGCAAVRRNGGAPARRGGEAVVAVARWCG